MTVIGNAALVKSEVAYDNIDDAQLTPEQVADLALDMVDADVLSGIEPMDMSILGTMDLSSVDKAFNSICDLRDNVALDNNEVACETSTTRNLFPNKKIRTPHSLLRSGTPAVWRFKLTHAYFCIGVLKYGGKSL